MTGVEWWLALASRNGLHMHRWIYFVVCVYVYVCASSNSELLKIT